MKYNKFKKMIYLVLIFANLYLAFFDLPIICDAANNFNVWNHLGSEPGVNAFFTVGGPGLYVLLRKIVVYASGLCMFFGFIALMIVRNPKVVLQRKQDIVDKITLIVLASGGIFIMNMVYKICNAIFYR